MGRFLLESTLITPTYLLQSLGNYQTPFNLNQGKNQNFFKIYTAMCPAIKRNSSMNANTGHYKRQSAFITDSKSHRTAKTKTSPPKEVTASSTSLLTHSPVMLIRGYYVRQWRFLRSPPSPMPQMTWNTTWAEISGSWNIQTMSSPDLDKDARCCAVRRLSRASLNALEIKATEVCFWSEKPYPICRKELGFG